MTLRNISDCRRSKQTIVLLCWMTIFCVAAFINRPDVFAQGVKPNVGVAAESTFHPGLMRVDFSITTRKPTLWDGRIRLSRGSFSDLTALGTNITSGGDFSFTDVSQNSLFLSTRTACTFCGTEATIIASLDSQLEIELIDRTAGKRYQKNVFVNRLLDSSTSIRLDDDCVVEITRAPADELPISVRKNSSNARFDSPSLLFPNESLELTVVPRSSSTKLTNALTLVATAKVVGSDVPFWTESREVSLSQIQQNDEQAAIPNGRFASCKFNIASPGKECVFDIVVELYAKGSGTTSRLSLPLPVQKGKSNDRLIARRVVQSVVLPSSNDQNSGVASQEAGDGTLNEKLLLFIDPTNPNWYKSISKRSLTPSPFHKSAATEKSNNGLLRSTFAADEAQQENAGPYDEAALSQNVTSVPQTFAAAEADGSVAATESGIETSSNASATPKAQSTGLELVLGQEPSNSGATIASPFNINNINSIFSFGSKGAAADDAAFQSKVDFIRNWERNQYQEFQRNLDRRIWSVAEDLWEKPISSGSSRLFNSEELKKFAPPQSKFVRLEPNGFQTSQETNSKALKALAAVGLSYQPVSWEAYPIPVQEPGKPHLLKIEYPTNFSQKLAVSILEPTSTGALLPTSPNAGLIVNDDPLSDNRSPNIAHYSLLFWPKTKTPIVLLSNCSSETPAAYGKIRIYQADASTLPSGTKSRGRVFGVAMTRPNLTEQFSAVLKPSFFGVAGVEDWNSFDSATSRLLYYLSVCNYDVSMLATIADGSALYPSACLNSSARYDGGVFLPSGGDPTKKDVLTLALNKFEAQGKSIIPVIKLNSTLPALEQRLLQLRSKSTPETLRADYEGVEWLGVDFSEITALNRKDANAEQGKTSASLEVKKLITSRQTPNGGGPYYNILHPEVEREVLKLVDELVSRCAYYNSFGGLALDIGADGWLALPDEVFYGMDDVTFGRFVRESQIQNELALNDVNEVARLQNAKGGERYAQRAEFIRSVCFNEWLEWRTNALHSFYRKVRETAATKRPDVRLYLVGTHMLDAPVCQKQLQPSLLNEQRLATALRFVGIDPRKYATLPRQESSHNGISQVAFITGADVGEAYDSTIVLLRPEFVANTSSFAKTALRDQLATSEAASLFSAGHAFPGTVFLHQSEPQKLYDFDVLSPYHPSAVELNTLAQPAGDENLRRFAHALAVNDMLCMFDGGDALPFGQEDTLRDWIGVYKSLPASPFKTWEPKNDVSSNKGANDAKGQTDGQEASGSNPKSIQPLVARYYHNSRETWAYLVNTAPFHMGVKLSVDCKVRTPYELFASNNHDEPTQVGNSLIWSMSMSPYELVAIRVDDPRAFISAVDVARPSEICGADGRMQLAIQNFVDRLVIAQKGLPFPLPNGNFEDEYESVSSPTSNVGAGDPELNSSDKGNLLGLEMPINLFKKSRPENAGVDSTVEVAPRSGSRSAFDPTRIPSWRAYGPNDVDIRLDTAICKEGSASLRIASAHNVGGVTSLPFVTPSTGRLCAQFSLGVRTNTKRLPLTVCLRGQLGNEPFVHPIRLENIILEKLRDRYKEDANSVVWIDDAVLFDRLPLDGLKNLTLSFELEGKGEVWIDQIQLYKLAFSKSEQSELMKTIARADYRATNNRVTDVIFMLDSYWAKLLKEQIPDDSELMVSRPPRIETIAERLDAAPASDKEDDVSVEKEASSRWWKFW